MTVKEFIEKLQEMPQDLLVIDWGGDHVEGCHIEEEYETVIAQIPTVQF